MTTFINGSVLLIRLDGRVDSGNAAETEKAIFNAVEQYAPLYAVIDAEKLEYISSVGLRVLLKLKKKIANTQLINVSAEVYEVLNMTGFTDIMDIKKALRQVSVDGCRVIGRGAFGTTYKLDNDTIVKVFTEGVAYEDIIREKESAKAAFICGVPTAIPFDTVKVGNRYGNVYELINAHAFSEDICGNPSKIDDYARQATKLLKLLASTRDSKGAFRSFKQTSLEKIDHLNRYVKGWEVFTPEEMELLFKLFYAVPERDTLIHGDFHTHNIFEQDGELLLIDMADTGTGHPIFELGNMYLPFVIMAEYEDDRTNQLIGMDNKTAVLFFNKVFDMYFSGFTPEDTEAVRELVKIFAQIRMMIIAAGAALNTVSDELKREYLLGIKAVLTSKYFKKPQEVLDEIERLTALF